MKRLILLHIVCCCFLVGKADYEMNTDSLIQVFQNLPHDSTRLVALNNIIRIEQNNPKCIQFSDTLMKEALFQKNDKYAGLAAYYHLLYIIYNGQTAGSGNAVINTQADNADNLDGLNKDVSKSTRTGYYMKKLDRKSTRLNSSHLARSRMPSSA